MAILPPELWDAVIRSVSDDDQTTLTSCAAVCKAWLPASRCMLFQRDVPSGAHRCCTLHDSSIEALAALLESPVCTISPYISFLHVPDNNSDMFWRLLPKLTILQSVQFLQFDQFAKRWPLADAHAAMQQIGSSVRVLKFDHTAFQDLNHLANFLSLFPALEELYLLRIRLFTERRGQTVDWGTVSSSAARHPLPPTLHTLGLPSDTKAMLCLIIGMASRQHIRKLVVELRDFELARCTCEFISSLTTVLEHLIVGVIYYPWSTTLIRHLDISDNTNLRILELKFMSNGLDWTAQGRFVNEMLVRVASPRMEEIRLTVPLEMLLDGHLSALRPVDDALALAQFAHLRKVVIAVALPLRAPRGVYETQMEEGKECFSHCHARGILEVVEWSKWPRIGGD
ncbi:hypothetical protein PLICRDRAFT_476873 [Plicaturopsis crispa FD-325 SS-3]|nr:hypothetical protein PLICRDRAFT_476873 [Plicaturopsis crispa FD-325 SS-3]